MTEAGQVFYQDAKKILSLFDESIKQCNKIAECCTGILRIGVWGGTRGKIIPSISSVFSQLCPEVSQEFVTTDGIDPAEMLQNKAIDVEVSYGYSGRKMSDLMVTLLSHETPACLVPRQSDWAKLKEITFSSLRGRSFIMPAQGRSAYHDKLRQYLLFYEPDIQIVDVLGHESGLTNMLLKKAPALVPPLFAEKNDNFILLPFEWKNEISIELITRKEENLLTAKFLQAALQAMDELSE